jgi:hypothetical protein
MMGWKVYEEGAMNADRFVEFVRSIITNFQNVDYFDLIPCHLYRIPGIDETQATKTST